MNNYLIPANSKKSMLWFGLFNKFDAILFGTGLGITLALLVFVETNAFWQVMIILAPALITGFLVMPIPNYHNMLTVITNAIEFFTTPQRLIWKGWCARDEKSE